jgi:hypothetical protein
VEKECEEKEPKVENEAEEKRQVRSRGRHEERIGEKSE